MGCDGHTNCLTQLSSADESAMRRVISVRNFSAQSEIRSTQTD